MTTSSILWTDVAREAIEHLRCLLAQGTCAPPAWEFPSAKYLLNLLESEGIPAVLLPPGCGGSGGDSRSSPRPNVVAHLAGSGAEEPILLLSHLDTAPKTRYDLDLAGRNAEGNLRGPGALMGTHLAVAQAMALILLVRSGVSLKRTVRFAATCEGAGGKGLGLKTLVENYLEHITCDIALGWGGISWIGPDGSPYSFMTSGEKGSLHIRLRSEIPGGETGVRAGDAGADPAERIVKALDRIAELEFPPIVSDASRIFVDSVAATFNNIKLRELLEGLNNPVTAAGALKAVELEPAFDPGLKGLLMAALRTERNVIRLNASAPDGLRPQTAEADILYSYPPGEDVESIALQVVDILRSDGVYLAEKSVVEPCESEIKPEILALARAAMKELDPDAKIVAGLSPWPAGLSVLRKFGTCVFGWEPFASAGSLSDTLSRRGGASEFIEAENFIKEIRAYYSFLIRVTR